MPELVSFEEKNKICTLNCKLPQVEDLLSPTTPVIELPQELIDSHHDTKTLNILHIDHPAIIDISGNTVGLLKIRNINLWHNPKLTKVKIDGLHTLETLALDDSKQIESIIVDNCYELADINLFATSFATDSKLKLFSAANCRSLTSISLGESREIGKIDLQSCYQLERLDLAAGSNIYDLNLYQCAKLTDEGLVLPTSLRFLKKVNLSGCESLKSKVVEIINLATEAKTIDISGCSKLTKDDFDQMLIQDHDQLEELILPEHLAEELTELSLNGCTSLQKLSFKPDNENVGFTNLKTLNLAGTKLPKDQIINIVKSANNLEVIDFTGCSLSDIEVEEILGAIPNQNKLRVLKLDKIDQLYALPLEAIEEFPTLQEISFSQSKLASLVGDEVELEQLTKIDLSGCAISGEDISNLIGKSRNLSTLIIQDSEDVDIANLIANKTLRELRVIGYQKTSLDLDNVSNLMVLDLSDSRQLQNLKTSQLLAIKELNLANSGLLTPSGINGILEKSNTSNLAVINLSGAKLSDTELSSIFKRLPKLTDLTISNLTLKPRGSDNYLLTIPKTLEGLKRINLDGSNLTSLSIASAKTLTEINCSNCKSLESISPSSELRGLEEVNFQGCSKLSGDRIFKLIQNSLSQIQTINIIGCRDLTIDHIRNIFANSSSLQQLYVNEDLAKQIHEEVKAGRMKLPDSLLVLSSNFDLDESKYVKEVKSESSEIHELKLMVKRLDSKVRALESSTILSGETMEEVLEERQQLESNGLYMGLKSQLSSLFKVSQLLSNPNIPVTTLIDKDTTALVAGSLFAAIPYVGRAVAAEFHNMRFHASGEFEKLEKLYLISDDKTAAPLIDHLARKLVSDPDVISNLEYLDQHPILDPMPNQKLTKFQKTSSEALDSAITKLKGELEDDSSDAKKTTYKYCIEILNKAKNAIAKPQDLPNRFNNSRYSQSSHANNLMISIMSAVFSSTEIKQGNKIDSSLVEGLVVSIKDDLRSKRESQEKEEAKLQELQQEKTTSRSRVPAGNSGR